MVPLSELTQEGLQYVRSKWVSQAKDLEKERARKLDRLTDRLDNQEEESDAQTTLETNLVSAQEVHDELVSSNATASSITYQLSVIEELNAKINSYGLSTSYVSKADARIAQMELDELEFAINQRQARITEIDALLV